MLRSAGDLTRVPMAAIADHVAAAGIDTDQLAAKLQDDGAKSFVDFGTI